MHPGQYISAPDDKANREVYPIEHFEYFEIRS